MAAKIRPGGPDLVAITGPMLPKVGRVQFCQLNMDPVQFWCAKSGPGPILVCKK